MAEPTRKPSRKPTKKPSSTVSKGKKFDKFEVEMERLGKKYTVEVDVRDVRSGRGKRVIISSGVFKDSQNWIRVQIRGAPTYQETIPRTLDCIDRRGFIPRAYRVWQGRKYGPWNDVAGYPKPRTQPKHEEPAVEE